jgi:hypothetical protein
VDVTLASFMAAAAFACAYLLGGPLGASEGVGRFWTRRRYVSAAAGISVAYIFVDVLPELEVQRQVVVGAAATTEILFAEQRIYLLALLSFVGVYGLQHMVLVAREGRRDADVRQGADAVYWIHLGGYALYSALIGYLVIDRTERGPIALAFYAFAMAVHFIIVDHALAEEHGRAYAPRGRRLLAASILFGWAIGEAVPLSPPVVARLFALLAGGVVITSLRTELPDDRQGRFWPFCLASVIFASVLVFA